jgi:hypothetical protein
VSAASAEPFVADNEDVIWRSDLTDRARHIQKSSFKVLNILGFITYAILMSATLIFVAWFCAVSTFPGSDFLSYLFGALAFAALFICIFAPVVAIGAIPTDPPVHASYILTSHRLLITREDGTSTSIYRDAVLAIDTDRLQTGFHVTLQILSGHDDGRESELRLSRFRLFEAEAIERKLIEWKNQTEGLQNHE